MLLSSYGNMLMTAAADDSEYDSDDYLPLGRLVSKFLAPSWTGLKKHMIKQPQCWSFSNSSADINHHAEVKIICYINKRITIKLALATIY
ncbi:unnamed protein product [Acanthoscelides obtectus]|uniref:Uncharacterized protein n=1 Tax=Acanthoscelides obtectus TaxID=200917 RepID=A0A9P0M3H9_ACAOB|nr:unnamed protein product [Acanthoscelides obtectus]CAK1677020.1 hypothetical protein AOBTE_LOCUS31071 [Acanthoscelides obtectus]